MQSGVVRRAQRDNGTKRADAGVREQLRREAIKRAPELVDALARGLGSSDPTVSVRAARAMLEEGFGKLPTAPADDVHPSTWISTLFRRPGRKDEGDELFACLQDGRIIPVMTVSFEMEAPLTEDSGGPHGSRVARLRGFAGRRSPVRSRYAPHRRSPGPER
jgi:hypothetical protein